MSKRLRQEETSEVKQTRLNGGILLEGTPRIKENRHKILIKIDMKGVSIHDGKKWRYYGIESKSCGWTKETQKQEEEEILRKFIYDWFL